MEFLRVPFGYVIEFCYKLIPNYALALLLFALIVKIVLFPFGIKQQKNQVKQAKLQPKIMAIRKRYAGRNDKVTQQKIQQETMELYQKESFNPASGCLPMIISLVLVMVVYNVMLNPLRYVNHVSSENMTNINNKIYEIYKPDEQGNNVLDGKISDKLVEKIEKGNPLTGIETVNVLRASDDISAFKDYLPEGFTKDELPDFTLFGKIDLSRQANLKHFDWMWIMPLLTFLFTFGSMKLTKKLTYQPPQQGDAAVSMKFMDFTMPLISAFFCFSVPAIVAVYWIYQNLFSVLQQFILKLMYPCPTFTEEELKAAELEMNKGLKAEKKSKRSGKIAAHRIDLDDSDAQRDASENKADAKEVSDESEKSENAKAKVSSEAPAQSSLFAPAALKDESDKKKKK